MSAGALVEAVTRCRICDHAVLEPVLDLGSQPPANSLRRSRDERLESFPLVLCRCAACATMQLSHTVSPEYLFRSYLWVSGTSQAARNYSRVFCERLLERCAAGPRFVLEVASNDGTFLRPFQECGHKVLGVDPARNIAESAARSGVPTVAEFFGARLARQVVAEHGPADAVIARNVISHVADCMDVMAGIEHCLGADGVGAIEFHRADIILSELHYDSIYHEHLFYHSLHSLRLLLERFGLKVFDVDESPLNAGSLVAYFSKRARAATAAVDAALERERRLGVDQEAPWRQFAKRCDVHRAALKRLVSGLAGRNRRIVGYGASARSSTLLNSCGIGCREVALLADRNPLKHQRYAAGSDILIVPPAQAFSPPPDVLLLTAWNLGDEILELVRREHGWQGEVLVPLPGEPRLLTLPAT